MDWGWGGFVLGIYIYLLPFHPFEVVSTTCFTSVVTAQWANGIQAQKMNDPFFHHIKKSFTINPYIFLGMGASFVLQWIAIYIIPELIHTVPLTLSMWKYPLLSFLASFFLIEIRKWIEYLLAKRRTS